MKWLYWLFGHKERMAYYDAELKEIARQNERVKAAYDLHREVLNTYGLEAYRYLVDAETIIKDDRSINVINYLDI